MRPTRTMLRLAQAERQFDLAIGAAMQESLKRKRIARLLCPLNGQPKVVPLFPKRRRAA